MKLPNSERSSVSFLAIYWYLYAGLQCKGNIMGHLVLLSFSIAGIPAVSNFHKKEAAGQD